MPRISETQQKIMVHNIFEQIIKTLLEPYYGATYRLQDLFCQLIDILSNAQYYNVQHDVHHGRGGKHAEKHKKMCRRYWKNCIFPTGHMVISSFMNITT